MPCFLSHPPPTSPLSFSLSLSLSPPLSFFLLVERKPAELFARCHPVNSGARNGHELLSAHQPLSKVAVSSATQLWICILKEHYMGCRTRVVNHWLDKDFRFALFLHSSSRQDPDPAASAFGSVQFWGQSWLSIMKVG